MYCSKCGEEIPDNSKFCRKCGNKIKNEENLEETAKDTTAEETKEIEIVTNKSDDKKNYSTSVSTKVE